MSEIYVAQAPAPTGPFSSGFWTSSVPATLWSSGNSTDWAGRSVTWSTPSPASPTVGSGSGASRRRSTPPPRRQARLPRLAALAEFERDLIRERTAAGLAAARARGRHGGRPSVMTVHKVRVARDMYASKQYTVAAIARTLGVSRASIYRNLAEPRS
jgi:hypothetical protein